MFWICAACSVAWFSAVVKASAAATMPCSTAGLVTVSQLSAWPDARSCRRSCSTARCACRPCRPARPRRPRALCPAISRVRRVTFFLPVVFSLFPNLLRVGEVLIGHGLLSISARGRQMNTQGCVRKRVVGRGRWPALNPFIPAALPRSGQRSSDCAVCDRSWTWADTTTRSRRATCRRDALVPLIVLVAYLVDAYAFLTCPPNAEVREVRPKAMPMILTEPEEWETWLSAPWAEAKAKALQRHRGRGGHRLGCRPRDQVGEQRS